MASLTPTPTPTPAPHHGEWEDVPETAQPDSGEWVDDPHPQANVQSTPPSRSSSYDNVPDEKLNWLQRAEKKAQAWGLVKPGSEVFSPDSLRQKKLALETAANSTMLGYLPQAAGFVKSGSLSNDKYLANRDNMSNELAQAKGGTQLAGQAIGMLPFLAAPAAAPAKTALGGFARAVMTGAVMGGASNPGDTTGELNPLQIPDRLHNAKTGAIVSGVMAAPFAGLRLLREKLAAKPGANAADVERIAAQLGIPRDQIPTEMLTDDPIVRDKAAALKRDPTFGGGMVRKNLQPFQDTIQNTAEGLVSDAAPATETGASVGNRLRESIPTDVEAKLAPAKQAYDEIAGPLEKAKPWQQAMKAGTTKLLAEIAPQDSTGELSAIIQRERDHFLENIESVADLKQYRTDIGKRMRDSYAKGDSRTGGIYNALYDILTNERDRSLERSILKSGNPIGAGVRAQQTVDKLRNADKAYREGINSSLGALGIEGRRSQPPQATINDYLSSKSPDQLPDVLWSPKDTEQASNFQKAFPNQFEDIRKLQLQKVANASSKSGTLSPTALNTQLTKMTPEAQGRLLGPNNKVVPDFRTLLKSVPDPNFNPSQTDIRRGTLQNWHPANQALSVGGAAELNLRKPLDYVNDSGAMKSLYQNPYKASGAAAAAVYQQPKVQRDQIMQKVQGTPWAQQLSQSKDDADFAMRYFSLSQTDPKFRAAVKGQPQ